MPRSIDGQGILITRNPPEPTGTAFPSFDTTSTSMPASGNVPLPGLVGVAPGRGVIMIEPVSVCHQVSTMGQRPPPITRWYHIQASGLMGSPTDPKRRNDDISCLPGQSSPQRINARMAVGAV